MQVIGVDEAAGLVRSGQTLTVSGLIGNMVAEQVLEAIERRFLDIGEPHGLTQIHPWLYGAPDGTGLNRWAHPGLLARIIGSTFILPVLSKTSQINRHILTDGVEGHCWPANSIFQMLRAVGAGRAGYLTTIGLGTFADPRLDGGRLNPSAREPLIELVTVAGQEHLFYPAIPIDVALIKASTADTEGNLFCEEEGLTQGILVQATAARNSGGVVIAQVKRIVEAGTMHPLMVEVPGALVDHVVVCEGTRQWQYGLNEGDLPTSTGQVRQPLPPPVVPWQGAAKMIARRALLEVRAGQLVNAGAGVPITAMIPTAEEEGIHTGFRWSVEHGVFGGRPLSATHWNPTAITSPTWLLDFYNGGGLDQSFLGIGQVDRVGNVNVGRMGDQLPGPGGFTDIAAGTRKVSFLGPFMGGGLEVEGTDGTLRILQEGRRSKFVADCEMVCFSGRRAVEQGQDVRYITERAVFTLAADGLVLSEVAPGIDVRADVLDHLAFPVRVVDDLVTMDARIYREEPMGLSLAST